MNRRDLLKAAPLVGGLFVPGSAEAKAALNEPAQGKPFNHFAIEYADAVCEFVRTLPKDFPQHGPTISIPFATMPINVYPKPYPDVPRHRCLDKLQPLVDRLRSCDGLGVGEYNMNEVAKVLWDRWKPIESPWVEEQDDALSAPDSREPKKTPYGLADRVVTPKYVIDVFELDTFRLATMLACVGDIASELRNKVEYCKQAWGKPITKHTAAYGPLRSQAKQDAYMLEFWAWISTAGRIS